MRKTLLLVLLALTACTSYRDQSAPMVTQEVDPDRYAGLWHEIARFPVFFQRGCTATTAEYGVIDASTLSVLNTCREGAPDGPIEQIEGTATVTGPGQFEVKLGRVPVAAPYWVLWVDETYETAVVGVPSGRAGWILAREPGISTARLADAIAVLSDAGYDTDRLIYDQQTTE